MNIWGPFCIGMNALKLEACSCVCRHQATFLSHMAPIHLKAFSSVKAHSPYTQTKVFKLLVFLIKQIYKPKNLFLSENHTFVTCEKHTSIYGRMNSRFEVALL